jgi:hypothetical protein
MSDDVESARGAATTTTTTTATATAAAAATATAAASLARENALLAAFLAREDPKGEFDERAVAMMTRPSDTPSPPLLTARERGDVVAATVDALRAAQQRERAAAARRAAELSSANDQAEAWLADVRRDAFAFRREVLLAPGGGGAQQQQKRQQQQRLARFFRRRADAYRAAAVRMRNHLAVARAETAKLRGDADGFGGFGGGGTGAGGGSGGGGNGGGDRAASRVDLERLRLEIRDLRALIAAAGDEVELLKVGAAREEAAANAARKAIGELEARAAATARETQAALGEARAAKAAAAAAAAAAGKKELAGETAGRAGLAEAVGGHDAAEDRLLPLTDEFVAVANEVAALSKRARALEAAARAV